MTVTEATPIQLYGAQHDFVFSTAHYAAFVAGIGSGKSYAGAVRATMASMGHIGNESIPTPNLGIVTAPTYSILRDASFRSFMDVADEYVADVNRSNFIVTMVNGSEVLFRTASDPEKMRGPNAAWWWGDEAAMYDPRVWRIMIGRLRQFGRRGYAWPTTTPHGRNWLYQEFIAQRREDYAVFTASTRHNPFVDDAFVRSLEESYAGDFARQELDAEFVAFEGLVYLEFQRDVHVTTTLPERFTRTIAGVDWGYANPGVILVFGVDYDGRLWLIHEAYERQKRIEEWASLARQLRDTYQIEAFFCDPAEPDYLKAFEKAGCDVQRATNDVMPGIQEVKSTLVVRGNGKPGLFVYADALNTIAEFEQYQWLEARDGIRDQPRKMNDHAMDALRYAILGARVKPKPAPMKVVKYA